MYEMDYGSTSPKQNRGYKIATCLILLIHLLFLIAIVGFLAIVNILPVKYLLLISVASILGWILQFFLLYKSKNLKTIKYSFSNVLSIMFIALAIMGFVYFGGLTSFISNISKLDQQYDIYTIRVLDSSPITDINGVKGQEIGYSAMTEKNSLDKCKQDISGKLSSLPPMKEYEDDDSLAGALLSGKSKVILFDESVLSNIEENREGFTSKTRVVYEIKVPVTKKEGLQKRENLDVTKDPFNVLIAGLDSGGKIASRGNCDVNIIATVNPKTKKILLTTTPRDYFVPLNGDKNKYDKLTHAGNYGVETSVTTLSKFYDIPIDFYVKVNFTSVADLVDALGGVTVNSERAFTSMGGVASFVKGPNNLNGKQALAFSRERKTLPGGDRERGKNQQLIITAIIDKITSPAIITKYSAVLNAFEKNTVTNMSSGELKALVKMQIDNPSAWATESINVDGTGDNRMTHSYKSKKLYVMIPNESTVSAAKAKIDQYMK